jgi:hypothetical protein
MHHQQCNCPSLQRSTKIQLRLNKQPEIMTSAQYLRMLFYETAGFNFRIFLKEALLNR